MTAVETRTTARQAERMPAARNLRKGRAALRVQGPQPLPSAVPCARGTASASDILGSLREALAGVDEMAYNSRYKCVRGAGFLLDYLTTQPGATWQERWDASPISASPDRLAGLVTDFSAALGTTNRDRARHQLVAGLQGLIAMDVTRPGLDYLAAMDCIWLKRYMLALRRDPHAGAVSDEFGLDGIEKKSTEYQRRGWIRSRITSLLILTGQPLAGLTMEDLVVFGREYRSTGRYVTGLELLGHFLVQQGIAEGNYRALTKREGQRSPAELVAGYGVHDPGVAALFVAYLERRATTLDWNTMSRLATTLIRNFWCVIEDLSPGIDTFDLSPQLVATWKRWLRHVRDEDGNAVAERDTFFDELSIVRRFYLDLQEWAHDEPERWGLWAARSPVAEGETRIATTRRRRLVKSAMHERIRERIPNVEALLALAAQRYAHAKGLLAATRSAERGTEFQFDGETYLRTDRHERDHERAQRVDLDATPTDLILNEEDAFWAYAASVLLRHTGLRMEELLELSQFALRDYVHPNPDIGRVPLLHVAPSKTDKERIVVLEPEAVGVLGAIIRRIREHTDCGRTLPLVVGYDFGQRQDMPPLPLLFQRTAGRGFKRGRTGPISHTYISARLEDICVAAAGDGEPLRFTAHDFRRIFATEKQNSGQMQPHIVQALLGHESLVTTEGYMAVFGTDVIAAHAQWIETRRRTRPDEYRSATEEEWTEFRENFMTRKIAIGDCMRQYTSPCDHEYACERCELARVDDQGAVRLRITRENIVEQIQEAERQGWRGEIEGKRSTLSAIDRKIESYDRSQGRSRLVSLPMPTVRRPPTD